MANTNYLKGIECWVRDNWLPQQFPGYRFDKRFLELITEGSGKHEFDAVSQDNSIVAGITTRSEKTKSGKPPSGKSLALYAELYFLSLVRASTRLLVLTNREMYKYFEKNSRGKVAKGIEIRFCQLPPEMSSKVADVQKLASEELVS